MEEKYIKFYKTFHKGFKNNKNFNSLFCSSQSQSNRLRAQESSVSGVLQYAALSGFFAGASGAPSAMACDAVPHPWPVHR